ncbi:MAG: hypothetical protein ACYDBH_08205, partial [Acidobacteriaceae bacterium]
APKQQLHLPGRDPEFPEQTRWKGLRYFVDDWQKAYFAGSRAIVLAYRYPARVDDGPSIERPILELAEQRLPAFRGWKLEPGEMSLVD